MKPDTILRLNALNTQFYQQIAESFAATRQHPWQGWETLRPLLSEKWQAKKQVSVLDLGCGTGRFGEFVAAQFPDIQFIYVGIDNSETLLDVATNKLSQISNMGANLIKHDLIEALQLNEEVPFSPSQFDLVVAFGIIHHIPSFELRKKFVKYVNDKVLPEGIGVIASWQFTEDISLIKRKFEPTQFGFSVDDLEAGDYFLPWKERSDIARYCHFIDKKETQRLLENAEFSVQKEYYADGKEGNLNHYLLLNKSI
jgi:tRNA (uracil-5-)-methyltransferase TRM9